MSNRVFSSSMRRMSLALGLALILLWLLSGVFITTTAVQAQPIDLTRPLSPSATGPSVVATVTVGSGPVGIGVNPTTNRIYVANSASSNVSVIDAANNTVITTVAVGGYPSGIGVNPTTNRVYASLRVSNTVSVIDGANNSVVAAVAAGAWPADVGINPVTNRIYVANQGTNDVLVIDGSNNEVSATVTVGSAPGGIAVNPTINHIYVTNYNGNNVSVIDGINNTVVATVTVGEHPMGIGVNPTTNRIYVANNTSNTVSVIDGTNNAVVATVTVGSGPVGISANPTTNRVYVANSTSNTVSVIDGTNNAVVATVTVGSSPVSRGDNVNPATGRVYVTNLGSNTVSVIQDATGLWYVAPPPLGNDANNCASPAAPCATIQHAIDVANSGDEIRVAAGSYTDVSVRPRNDITTTGVVTQMVYVSKTITIRGGFTTTNWITPDPSANPTVLDAQGQGRVFYITGDISPTIEGLHIQGGYETDQDNHCAPVGFCARVGTGIYGINAHVAVNAAWIENNQGEVANFGGAVFVENGQLRLDSSRVISNVGSGVFLNNSTGLLTDNVISGNTASNGGGVQLLLSTATLSNNQILSNTANHACGGGICAAYTSTLTLTANVIRGNRIEASGFDRDGGGISIFYRSQGNLTNNVIEGNSADGVGGGVYVSADSRANFVSNTVRLNAASTGGGIYLVGSNNSLTGDLIAENDATGDGGGIYATDHLTLTNSHVLSNTAHGNGGGASANGNVVLVGGTFNNNVSGVGGYASGGGLWAGGNLTLSSTQFISNTSIGLDPFRKGEGGGAYVTGRAILMGGLFELNTATWGNFGGGLRTGSLSMNNTTFLSNTACMGGGVQAYGPVTLVDGLFQNNQALWGGGGGLYTESTLAFTETQFIANTAYNVGGGADVFRGVTSTGGLFLGNKGQQGAGLYANDTLILSGTQFIENMATEQGGGVFSYQYATSHSRIVNALFARNTAGINGQAMNLHGDGSVDILYTTIANPSLEAGTGIRVDTNGTINITNTIVASYTEGISIAHGTVNSDYNLFFHAPISLTLGNHDLIDQAPAFVDPNSDDYHLQFDSAAIDHGIDAGITTDLDGNPRPIGAGFDIGAYEYQFAPSNYTLTVAMAGTGSGVVSPTVGTHQYLYGDVVTLTVTPLISSTFVGFSGDVVTTAPQITLTLDANKSVTATFILKTFVITPTAGTNGTITPSTPQTVNYGASQTFTITPNSGYHIADVSVDGISQGAIDLYAFTNVTANHSISAAFAINAPNTYTLMVNYAGTGLGSVTLNPPGPTYIAGTVVTLTAVPSTTSQFMGWSGAVLTTTNPLVVMMNGSKNITATFVSYRTYLPLVLK